MCMLTAIEQPNAAVDPAVCLLQPPHSLSTVALYTFVEHTVPFHVEPRVCGKCGVWAQGSTPVCCSAAAGRGRAPPAAPAG